MFPCVACWETVGKYYIVFFLKVKLTSPPVLEGSLHKMVALTVFGAKHGFRHKNAVALQQKVATEAIFDKNATRRHSVVAYCLNRRSNQLVNDVVKDFVARCLI